MKVNMFKGLEARWYGWWDPTNLEHRTALWQAVWGWGSCHQGAKDEEWKVDKGCIMMCMWNAFMILDFMLRTEGSHKGVREIRFTLGRGQGWILEAVVSLRYFTKWHFFREKTFFSQGLGLWRGDITLIETHVPPVHLQAFIEHLLWTWHCSRSWGGSSE